MGYEGIAEQLPIKDAAVSQEAPERKTMLIVDDDAGIGDVVAASLEDEGFDVIRAATAEEATNALDTSIHTLKGIFLDGQFPYDPNVSPVPGNTKFPAAQIVLDHCVKLAEACAEQATDEAVRKDVGEVTLELYLASAAGMGPDDVRITRTVFPNPRKLGKPFDLNDFLDQITAA